VPWLLREGEVLASVERADTPFTNRFRPGDTFRATMAHGDGNYFADERTIAELEDEERVVLRYLDNPNGSLNDIAGICNEGRNVVGLMPHPEAYLYPENHPRWIAQRAAGTLPKIGLGLQLLANGVRAAIG